MCQIADNFVYVRLQVFALQLNWHQLKWGFSLFKSKIKFSQAIYRNGYHFIISHDKIVRNTLETATNKKLILI